MNMEVKFCELNVERCAPAQTEFLNELEWDIVILCLPALPTSDIRAEGYSVVAGNDVCLLIRDELAYNVVCQEDSYIVIRLGSILCIGVYFSPEEQLGLKLDELQTTLDQLRCCDCNMLMFGDCSTRSPQWEPITSVSAYDADRTAELESFLSKYDLVIKNPYGRYTYESLDSRSVVDLVAISSRFNGIVGPVEVEDYDLTDHRLVTLVVGGIVGVSVNDYAGIEQALLNSRSPNDRNSLVQGLDEGIREIVLECIRPAEHFKYVWWNCELETLKKATKSLKKRYKRSNENPLMQAVFRAAKNYYRSRIIFHKAKFVENLRGRIHGVDVPF